MNHFPVCEVQRYKCWMETYAFHIIQGCSSLIESPVFEFWYVTALIGKALLRLVMSLLNTLLIGAQWAFYFLLDNGKEKDAYQTLTSWFLCPIYACYVLERKGGKLGDTPKYLHLARFEPLTLGIRGKNFTKRTKHCLVLTPNRL